MKTNRLLMTDDAAGTAYVQDWTLDTNGEVADVTEVCDLTMPPDLALDDVADAAIKAATAAGFDVCGSAGDNNDLGDAFYIEMP